MAQKLSLPVPSKMRGSMEQSKVLICDSDPFDDNAYIKLHRAGFELVLQKTIAEGLRIFEKGKFCAVILCYSQRATQNSLNVTDTVSIIRKIDAETPVIVMTDENSLETEREIRNAGIFYLLIKPVDNQELLGVLKAAHVR